MVRKYVVGGHAGANEYCVIFSVPATRNHRTLSSANDASLPTLETLGNGTQVATSYTPIERVTRIEGSGSSTTNLQNLSYNWDLAGNLHNRIDNRQTRTEQFAYDSMNRLLTFTLTNTSTQTSVTNLTMAYDAAGNINTKSDVSTSPYATNSFVQSGIRDRLFRN